MPYIEPGSRIQIALRQDRGDVVGGATTPGDLNFIISEIVMEYVANTNGGISYTKMNEVVGVLECAKLELYRRVLAPYEDDKIKENGDIESYAETLLGWK